MDVALAGSSALEIIRLVRVTPSLKLVPTANMSGVVLRATFEGPKGSASKINFCALGLSTPPTKEHPVFMRVPSASHRIQIDGVRCLVFPKQLPSQPLLQLISTEGENPQLFDGRRVFVESAPFACATVANRYQRLISAGAMTETDATVRLVELVMELTGRYVRDSAHPRTGSVIERIVPFTTLEEFRRFIAESHYVRGTRLLSKALLWARDDARSAMETCLWIELTGPRHRGFYGFSNAKLNVSLNPTDAQRRLMRHKLLTPDLFWEAARVAVEYQGYEPHTSSSAFAEDNRRMNDYQVCGVIAFFVTFRDVRNVAQLDKLAQKLAEAMALHGLREEPRRLAELLRNQESRAERARQLARLLPPVRR